MKVVFDADIKVAGIGLVPWNRLGPERWLPNYKIASLYDWDINAEGGPEVFALNARNGNVELSKQTSKQLLGNDVFQNILHDELPDYSFLTYKPVGSFGDLKFLESDQALAQTLENKVLFREMMSPLGIPFPEYRILDRKSMNSDILRDIKGDDAIVVLQDEHLSGGKGTYFVSDDLSLQKALNDIESSNGGKKVVISRMINGSHERSLQCCVTRYGVFVGPMQKQIVNNPLLANLAAPGADRYCGVEIGGDDRFASAYDEMKRLALIIGERAQEMGYKGIYGVDFLIGEDGTVFVLEMNPRITGATPLVTMLHREGKDIPFYLLHILELGNIEYKITDMSYDSSPPTGSLLLLHTQSPYQGRISNMPQSGVYKYEDVSFDYSDFRLSDTTDPQLLLQRYVPEGSVIRPGGRTVVLYSNRPVLSVDDKLLPRVIEQVNHVNDIMKIAKV